MDSTINQRAGADLHVNTHEERKGGNFIDVRKTKQAYFFYFNQRWSLFN